MTVYISDEPAGLYDVCYVISKLTWRDMEILADHIEKSRRSSSIAKRNQRALTGKDILNAVADIYENRPRPKQKETK